MIRFCLFCILCTRNFKSVVRFFASANIYFTVNDDVQEKKIIERNITRGRFRRKWG